MSQYTISHRGFYSVSLVSLALLLVLCGFFLTAWFFSGQFTTRFNEDIVIIAELEENIGDEGVNAVLAKLKSNKNVLAERVRFVSKEEALESMRKKLGDEMILENMQNPFTDMVEFSMQGDRLEPELVDEIAQNLENDRHIKRVHRPRDFYEDVFMLLRRIKYYALLILMGALVVTAVLIHHIMRLNILSQEDRIRTMELVGASSGFIRRPFMRLGRKMALQAWGLAVIFSIGAWTMLLGPVDVMRWIASIPSLVSITGLLVIALGICMFSTLLALGKTAGTTILRAN